MDVGRKARDYCLADDNKGKKERGSTYVVLSCISSRPESFKIILRLHLYLCLNLFPGSAGVDRTAN